jgi:hypothetical protein
MNRRTLVRADRRSAAVQRGGFRIVEIEGQGYGYMSPMDYESTPTAFRRLIRVLGYCATEAEARSRVKALSSLWIDGVHAVRRGG